MAVAGGFEWFARKSGDVVITHHGRTATTLRGATAADFLVEIGDGDQELMARLTGSPRSRGGA